MAGAGSRWIPQKRAINPTAKAALVEHVFAHEVAPTHARWRSLSPRSRNPPCGWLYLASVGV